MITLESLKDRIGIVMVSELLGTSLLVVTFSLTGPMDVLVNAIMYFLCVLLCYQTSCAQLNPAITFALYIREGKYKENHQPMALIITAQLIGAFLGLELALLLRVVHGPNGQQIEPPMYGHLPGIQSEVGDNQWLTVALIDAIGCALFTVFYLRTLEKCEDFVWAAFALGLVYYAAVWLVFQTTSSLFNPAIAVSVGFENMWNFTFMGEKSDQLWKWFWVAWLVGPFIGSACAIPALDAYQKQIKS